MCRCVHVLYVCICLCMYVCVCEDCVIEFIVCVSVCSGLYTCGYGSVRVCGGVCVVVV